MRESKVEAYLVKRVQAMGGEVRKVKWISRRGAPDRLVMLPARTLPSVDEGDRRMLRAVRLPPRAIWVELKRPGEVAEPHQAREHERLRRFGMPVTVIDSLEGVEELLA